LAVKSIDDLELDLISALSMSTHVQIGASWSLFAGEHREAAINLLNPE
jgi:hypothetical protein